jgi:hypothetical protein
VTLTTTDYLEYYLTLAGWIVENGIWEVLAASGLFALPFAVVVIQEWLRAHAEGADEGNKGVLSSLRIENRAWAAVMVILFGCIPFITVDLNTLQFDTSRSTQCEANVPLRISFKGRSPLREMFCVFEFARFVGDDNLRALPERFCFGLLDARCHTFLLFLGDRVDAAPNLPAQLTGLLTGFRERYLRVAPQAHVPAVRDGLPTSVDADTDYYAQHPNTGTPDDLQVQTIHAANRVTSRCPDF